MPGVDILIIVLLLAIVVGLGLIFRRQRSQAERRARNLRALFEVSRRATANLDRQQVLEVVVQAVQDVMGYHMASILLLEDTGQALVAAAISTNLRDRIPVGSRVPVGHGLVGVSAQ